MAKGIPISKYYKSFSGTDTIAFLMFPGINPIVIGSLTTISYSMYRNKVPVINIGRTNINGITRGSRIYAGTMVFTLINQHWLRELQEQASYLSYFPTLKTDELPLFDIMIVSANEYGSSCAMFIYGVDFTDEAQTISIEDLFTENLFKFVAREVAVFDEVVVTASESLNRPKKYLISTGILKNYYVDEQTKQTENLTRFDKDIKPLTRTLYLVTNGDQMMGADVAAVQQLLNMAGKSQPVAVTYKFDRMTDGAVRDFQATVGLIVNGVVDNNTYTKLLQYTKDGRNKEFVQVINKSGAKVYYSPDTNSSITKTLPYLASVEVFNKIQDNVETFYQTRDGYISVYDTYEYISNTNAYTFEQLRYGDVSSQVTILQNALHDVYDSFTGYELGVFDELTEQYVKKFQRDYSESHGLIETGTVDNYTWAVLLDNPQTTSMYRYYGTNHTTVQTSNEPGIYNVSNLDYLNNFTNTVHNNNTQQVKYSVLSIYPDGNTKTDTKVLTFDGEEEHSVNEFINMFKDDVKFRTPTDVYYIIYPYGSTPYKWHFRIKGGESNG